MADIQLKLEMVINTAWGGYNLSRKAQEMIAERKGWTLTEEDGFLYVEGESDSIRYLVPRHDPDLVAVVRELGDAANVGGTQLKVVEIDIGVEIENHDGKESVRVYGSAS